MGFAQLNGNTLIKIKSYDGETKNFCICRENIKTRPKNVIMTYYIIYIYIKLNSSNFRRYSIFLRDLIVKNTLVVPRSL